MLADRQTDAQTDKPIAVLRSPTGRSNYQGPGARERKISWREKKGAKRRDRDAEGAEGEMHGRVYPFLARGILSLACHAPIHNM